MTHGYISCAVCKDLFKTCDTEDGFERWGQGEPVRLINNPASWGSVAPKVFLLGFSKGATQNKAMAEAKRGRATFESIPFKGMRKRLGWLLRGLRLTKSDAPPDSMFSRSETRFQSTSIIRCSISARTASGAYSYKLKDILEADSVSGGKVTEILQRCTKRHLASATPGQHFVLLGLDEAQIKLSKKAFEHTFGPLQTVKPTVYRNRDHSWVHVAHPSGSQTDPQYSKWCAGETSTAKVVWAREELTNRGVGDG
jgi:hypothetical protein